MERNLIKRAKQGDKDAFLKLMNAQMQTMYKLAWTYLKNEDDVADIVQDTILTCFEKLPTLREEKYFKTWMMKIVTFVEREYSNSEWNEMLGVLDEKYRTVLLLYYLENFNTRESSQILDMNESTVRIRLKRGRDKLIREYAFVSPADGIS